MSDFDLEKGLSEFLEKAGTSFLSDSSYAESVARDAMALQERAADAVD